MRAVAGSTYSSRCPVSGCCWLAVSTVAAAIRVCTVGASSPRRIAGWD